MPTRNEALLEAYACCPPSARIYYTLEIWQSSFAAPARGRQCRRRHGLWHRTRRAARRRRDGDVYGLPGAAALQELGLGISRAVAFLAAAATAGGGLVVVALSGLGVLSLRV
jgi:hypothetical protein